MSSQTAEVKVNGQPHLVDVDNNILFVKFFGGCQGCSSSKATLKGGIETLIKQNFPDITEVVDVTDHQSGSAPFM